MERTCPTPILYTVRCRKNKEYTFYANSSISNDIEFIIYDRKITFESCPIDRKETMTRISYISSLKNALTLTPHHGVDYFYEVTNSEDGNSINVKAFDRLSNINSTRLLYEGTFNKLH
jgi:hypothetical protein